ncbi:uncharacterized protein LOC127726445 [Mytilus californianus]|uniref:uncharacterized protein LOC127726445 n=1 Tax=Mytilus californianus TaxID=6549 RepID=UPI002246009A|nr:uncharacterized protein LOC127726445 [Mytilus californianus]
MEWIKEFANQASDVDSPEDSTHEDIIDDDDHSNDRGGNGNSTYQQSLTRKQAMSAYLNGELANELRQRNMSSTLGMTNKMSRELVMQEIDKMRRQEHYPHDPKHCTDECKKKGCENLRVIDGCWKVCMPHCMFAMEMEVQGFPLLNFPNVCTSEPKPGSVFCADHYQILKDKNIPTQKEDFLQFIGCKKNPSSTEDIKAVDDKIKDFSKQLASSTVGVSSLKYQNTEQIVSKVSPSDWQSTSTDTVCNKDTGEKARLRQRSRGHFVCVTGGGHIQYFEPLFKSEGPCQVFMITIRSLLLELSTVPEDQLEARMESLILAYDNMCHLDCIKAAKEDLPFPAPLNKLWKTIKKVVDRLHLQNHKDARCKVTYDPSTIPESYNTMIAEQTFSWFSRFKKIANSMTQTHHLFYIHRQIQRRNKYSGSCRLRGKAPLLPGINITLQKKAIKD